jgi:GTP cyclohydrolase I
VIKVADAQCTRCGGSEGLQARFIGIGDASAILCEACQEEFDHRRKIDALSFIGNESIKEGVSLILQGIHEMYDMDLEQDHLKQTPSRVSRMFAELCWGYSVDPAKYLKILYPVKERTGLVKIGPVNFTSMCIHHLAVISGRVYVGYVPGEWIVGLSKIPRVILAFAKRLQLQEYMTFDIIECLQKALEPQGLMVIVDARHDCMCKRGVSSSSAWTTTAEVRGVFFDDDRHTKEEFLTFVQMHDTSAGA